MGLGMMMGIVKPRRFGKYIAGLIFTPILIGVGWTITRTTFAGLSPIQQILFFIPALLIGLAIMLRLVLPRDVWAGVVAGFIYDVLKFLFRLPVRMVRYLYLLKK
jgi:hypothetical protein